MRKSEFFKVFAVFSAVILLFCACSGVKNEYKNAANVVYSPSEYGSFGNAAADSYLKLYSDGIRDYLFDKRTSSFAVDTGYAVYSALPVSGASCIAEITVSCPSGQYVLNTSANSAAFSSFSYETDEEGVTVNYVLSDLRDRAEEGMQGSGGVCVELPVRYDFCPGGFDVSIDMSAVGVSDGGTLTKVSLLPGFDRSEKKEMPETETDAPESAAEGETQIENEETNESESEQRAVPGNENALDDVCRILLPDGCGAELDTSLAGAYRYSFGFGSPVAASFCPYYAVRYGGAGFAAVVTSGAERAEVLADSALGRAGFVFHTADTESNGGKLAITETYTGTITAAFRFVRSLSQPGAISFAPAVRSALCRAGLSFPESSHAAASVIVDFSSGSFAGAESVLRQLKAKGIDSVNVILSNGLDSKLDAKNPGSDADELTQLYSYAEKQKYSVYAPGSIADAAALAESGGSPNADGIIFGSSSADEKRTLSGLFAFASSSCSAADISGCCLVTDVPFATVNPETEYYKAEPFVPAVLRGSVAYAGKPATLSGTPRLELLKAIEYGGEMYVAWSSSENDSLYYGRTLNDVAGFYPGLASAFALMHDAEITAHYEVCPGVMCTCFDGSLLIYVNYNNYSVNLGDIAVMPYDYIAIG